jgi:aminoglycoside phosphotransferase (APT) family kinase protein
MELTSVAAVGGHRLTWPELPERVRAALASRIGTPVVGASSRSGGFSPALASVLALADGRAVFAKASSVARSEFAVAAIRRECEVLAALPASVPAPALITSYDDGEWVALVTEAIDGHNPVQPWDQGELKRFLAAATILAASLTPSPIVAAPFAEFVDEFTQWRQVDPARLDTEFRTHLDALIDLESGWVEAVDGTSLLHGDLRSDNFVLTEDSFAVVDWPSVAIGAPWLDLLYALPSIAMHGGGDIDALWRDHPLSTGVDDDAVNAAIAGATGLFIGRSLKPPVPFLPTIRQFQRAQGIAAFTWLARRMHW